MGLSNVLVVVTRYFGGILSGTGGLVKAYSDVTKQALDKAKYIEKCLGYKVKIYIEYDKLQDLKYYVNKNNIKIVSIEYLENVEVIVEIIKKDIEKLTKTNNNNPFKNIKYDILEEKYIEL